MLPSWKTVQESHMSSSGSQHQGTGTGECQPTTELLDGVLKNVCGVPGDARDLRPSDEYDRQWAG